MTQTIAPHLTRVIELNKLYPGFVHPPADLAQPRNRRTTSAKQAAFAWAVSRLSAYTFDVLGHRHVMGDFNRDERAFGPFGQNKRGVYGAKKSAHKVKCAGDLPIFTKDSAGRYQYRKDTPSHQEQGEFWEQLAEHTGFDLVWGGRFEDGNHFSHRIWGVA